MNEPQIVTSYLTHSLPINRLQSTVDICVDILKDFPFDSIAFRGMSGALVAPSVALRLQKSLLLVRKGESCYSKMMVEGDKNARMYVIIDDGMCTGATYRAIVREIREFAPEAQCVGVVQYYRFQEGYSSPRIDKIENLIPDMFVKPVPVLNSIEVKIEVSKTEEACPFV